MWNSFDYAGFAKLYARSLIMHKIMCAHNRIIPHLQMYGWYLHELQVFLCSGKLAIFILFLVIVYACWSLQRQMSWQQVHIMSGQLKT